MLKIIFYAFFISITLQDARTEFLFSPSYSNINGSYTRGAADEGQLNGKSIGAHLLGHMDIWNIGMMGNYYRYDYPQSFLSANQTRYKGWDFGPMVGMSFNKVRIWYSYLFTSMEMESTVKGYYFGKGYRYGIGIKIVDHVFLTLEQYSNKFNEKEVDNGATQAIDPHIQMDATLLGITFPFFL